MKICDKLHKFMGSRVTMPGGVLEFGPFLIDPRKRLLTREGSPVSLTPKAFDTLLLLIENRERVVERQVMIESLWPETAVEDNNLNQCIAAIRKALGEKAGENRYVATVPGQGYRFVEEVRSGATTGAGIGEPEAEPAAAAPPPVAVNPSRRAWMWPGTALLAILAASGSWAIVHRQAALHGVPRSLVVVPVAILNPEAGDEALTLGLADAIIQRLSGASGIAVRSLGATLEAGKNPMDSARAAGADAALEVTMQNGGGSWHVRARMVSADSAVRFTDEFEEKREALLTVEDRIAARVVSALETRLSTEERMRLAQPHTTRPEAFREYVLGRYYESLRAAQSYQKAIEHFHAAIAIDPQYGLAWSGLADTWLLLYGWGEVPVTEAIRNAKEAAARAVELSPDRAEPHATLGLAAENYDRDYARAEAEYHQAIALDANYARAHHWYGEYLGLRGRFDEGLAELRVARQLDPLSPIIVLDTIKILKYAKRDAEALDLAKTVLRADPNNSGAQWFVMWIAAIRHDPSVREMYEQRKRAGRPSGVAVLSACAGKLFETGESIRSALIGMENQLAREQTWSWDPAVAYACAGEYDKSLDWIERILRNRETGPMDLPTNPIFDPMRKLPRFQKAVRDAGF